MTPITPALTAAHLTDSEIDAICAGLHQNAARIRYLRRLGLRVERKPNGRPLVARTEWDQRMGTQNSTQPGHGPVAINAPRWSVATAA